MTPKPIPRPPSAPLVYVPTLTPRTLGVQVYQSHRAPDGSEPLAIVACLIDGDLRRVAAIPGRLDDLRRPIRHIVRRFLVDAAPTRVDRLTLNSNTADALTVSCRNGFTLTPLITTPEPVDHPLLAAHPWVGKRRTGTTRQGTTFRRRTLNDIAAGIVIHTDGSAALNKAGMACPDRLGAGWVIESERLEAPMKGRRGVTVAKRTKNHLVLYAELAAVRYAVEDMLEVFPKAGRKPDRPVRIYLDSLHAVQFLRGTRDWDDLPGLARDLASWWERYLRTHPNTRVIWTPGHTGHGPNEEADRLAKMARR